LDDQNKTNKLIQNLIIWLKEDKENLENIYDYILTKYNKSNNLYMLNIEKDLLKDINVEGLTKLGYKTYNLFLECKVNQNINTQNLNVINLKVNQTNLFDTTTVVSFADEKYKTIQRYLVYEQKHDPAFTITWEVPKTTRELENLYLTKM
jgi:hypothetical protein